METIDADCEISETLMLLREISLNRIFKGITPGEYTLLKIIRRMLKRSGKDAVYVSEIAGTTKLSVPAVSRTLRILESKGMVRRETDKENRRKTFVFITVTGLKAENDAAAAIHRLIEIVCAKAGKEDVDKFNTLAKKIYAVITDELKLIEERK